MNVLVTGGKGYIGQHVVQMLEQSNHNVTSLDMSDIPAVFKSQNYISPLVAVEYIMEIVKPDVVVHLAGIVGEPACLNDPKRAFFYNYDMTRNVMDACKQQNCKMVFASSCSVYGNQEGLLTEESTLMPLGLYATTKYLNEIEMQKELENYAILRFGTVYGTAPRQRFDLVINKFTALAATGQPLQVYGGKQERPFTSVRDIARAIVHAVENNLQGIYNVADTNFNMKRAAERIAETLQSTVEVIETKEDNRSYEASSQKLLDTGFEFKANFEDEVKKLAQWVTTEGNDWRDKKWYNI